MGSSAKERKAQAAWDRIEALGGHGVWEADIVIVSLAGTGVADEDLALFRDFPFVQTLDLSHTGIGDAGLASLTGLRSLEDLTIVDTKVTSLALEAFRRDNPTVNVIMEPPPQGLRESIHRQTIVSRFGHSANMGLPFLPHAAACRDGRFRLD